MVLESIFWFPQSLSCLYILLYMWSGGSVLGSGLWQRSLRISKISSSYKSEICRVIQTMAPPLPLYSQEEFNLFHSIDRTLYSILVIHLWRDPIESMQVIALYIWLERTGFRNLVKKMLPLPYLLLSEIAEEAVTCLNIIVSETLPSEPNTDIPLIHSLVEKEISLQFFYENRVLASQGITKVLNEVCMRALSDIMEKARKRNSIASSSSTSSSSSSSHQLIHLVPPEDRTMFVTFSKGYPVYEWELREFFLRNYGDCIETLHMQEVQPHEQALFARIVFQSSSTIGIILNGMGKAKFTINGKHVWARKFVPKKPKPSLPAQPTLHFLGSFGLNF